jgi:hypothetical protein
LRFTKKHNEASINDWRFSIAYRRQKERLIILNERSTSPTNRETCSHRPADKLVTTVHKLAIASAYHPPQHGHIPPPKKSNLSVIIPTPIGISSDTPMLNRVEIFYNQGNKEIIKIT